MNRAISRLLAAPTSGARLVAGSVLLAALFGTPAARAQLCASTGDACSPALGCCEGVCETNPDGATSACVSACDSGMRGLFLPGQLAIGRDPGDGGRVLVNDNARAGFGRIFDTGDDWGDSRAVTAMAWGDIDGDGLLELAVGRNAGDNSRVIVYDDQAHGFAALASTGHGWGDSRFASALAFGDLNGDGVDELVVGRSAGDGDRLVIYDFDGSNLRGIQGLFDTWGDSRSVSALAVGDIDGDGKDEVAVGRNAGDNSRVVIIDDMTQGFRGLQTLGEDWGDSRAASALAMADVDGNGRAELLVGRNQGDGVRGMLLWKEAVADPFQPFQTALEFGRLWGDDRYVTALAFRDLNEDGVPDIAAGRNPGDNVRVQVIGLDTTLRAAWSMDLGTGWGDDRGCRSLAAGMFDDIVPTGKHRNDLAMGRSDGDGDRVIVQELYPETASVLDVARFGDAWGDSRSPAALAFATAPRDRDGDGLLDAWETRGIDADCDGHVDLPLHQAPYSADINHKDLYLELDWMGGEAPTRRTTQALVRAFSLAPLDVGGIMNPDGGYGIRLHLDTGDLNDEVTGEGGVPGNCNNNLDDDGDSFPDELDPECPVIAENLGGGNAIGAVSVSRLDAAFYALKAANFDPARRFAFRYGVMGRPAFRDPTLSEDGFGPLSCLDGVDNGALAGGVPDGGDGADSDCQGDPSLPEGAGAGANTCGDTLDNDGDNLPDGADPDCQYGGGWGEVGGNDFIEYNHDPGTIMHEFGHTLGLGHGGRIAGLRDDANCKPHYLSVMNYDYQLGIPQAAASVQGDDFDGDGIREILDFSPPRHDFNDGLTGLPPFRTGTNVTLDETQLLETSVLDIFDSENLFVYTTSEAVTAALAGSGNARELGAAAGSCLNATDDDGDGLLDGFNAAGSEGGIGANTCSNGVDDDGNGVADRFDITCHVDLDCVGVKLAAPLNLPPDWSGDGTISASLLAVDIDKESAITQQPAACRANQGAISTALRYSDDWTAMSLPFLVFGDSTDGPLNVVETPEPTSVELRAQRVSLFPVDVSLDLSLDPARVRPGQQLLLRATIENLSQAAARDAEVVLKLPAGTSFVSGEGCEPGPRADRHRRHRHRHHHHAPDHVVCELEQLPASGSVELAITLKVSRHVRWPWHWISGTVSLDSGSDVNPDNNQARVVLLTSRQRWPWRHFGPRHRGWPW